jgi:hypothetical protein
VLVNPLILSLYSLHTFVLNLLMAVFMLMHLPMIRKQGISIGSFIGKAFHRAFSFSHISYRVGCGMSLLQVWGYCKCYLDAWIIG